MSKTYSGNPHRFPGKEQGAGSGERGAGSKERGAGSKEQKLPASRFTHREINMGTSRVV